MPIDVLPNIDALRIYIPRGNQGHFELAGCVEGCHAEFIGP